MLEARRPAGHLLPPRRIEQLDLRDRQRPERGQQLRDHAAVGPAAQQPRRRLRCVRPAQGAAQVRPDARAGAGGRWPRRAGCSASAASATTIRDVEAGGSEGQRAGASWRSTCSSSPCGTTSGRTWRCSTAPTCSSSPAASARTAADFRSSRVQPVRLRRHQARPGAQQRPRQGDDDLGRRFEGADHDHPDQRGADRGPADERGTEVADELSSYQLLAREVDENIESTSSLGDVRRWPSRHWD